MAVEIDVVSKALLGDKADNGFLRRALSIHPNALETWSIIHFTERVRWQTTPGEIDALRIFGHGAPGEQNVAGGFHGEVPDIVQDEFACLMLVGGHLNKVEWLRQITDRFSPRANVSLHGCFTGAGPKGRRLCIALAQLWNVSVSAAYDKQFADRQDSYEGKFITAHPDGRVSEGGAFLKNTKCVFADPGQSGPHAAKAVHIVGARVTEQDWLSNIAKKYYGDQLLWPLIFDANKSASFTNPNRIVPNMRLTVPDIGKLSAAERAAIRQRGLNWR